MEYVIETQNLSKQYKTKLAVDGVSIKVAKGEIYGLIGKNGAGKTTLMRLILGLATPTSGKILLFGEENNIKALTKIGSLIESPALFKNCTAYENMVRYSILFGADKNEINPLLQLVGLTDTGSKKADQFSLGMKQRLALAIAMLSHPEVLILDEPINGLDPAGIKEIRDIILDLNKKGVTFIISSHLLDELAKVVTRYGIIADGKLIEEISTERLKATSNRRAKIICDDTEGALKILKENFEGFTAEITASGEILFACHLEQTAKMNELLVKSGIKVSEIKISRANYENFFIERLGQ